MKKLLTIILVLFLLPTGIALAIADPDSVEVSAVYVYESLLEEDDVGILIDYYIDYPSLPDETVTEAFLAVFVDTDGATQLRSVAPYTYTDSGYGKGLVWIYFSAADVATHSIDSANEALYRIWLTGNPTLAWAGDPPITIAGIDYWVSSTVSTDRLVALRVLHYADILELAWSPIDLIEETSAGNKLTGDGEEYFTNVITSLRTIAPAAFSTGEYGQTVEDIDYTTLFGAVMEDGTGTVAGSPITLTEGSQDVNVTVAGTFILTLQKGTTGNVTNNTGTVTGSPVDIMYGLNTITVPPGGEGLLTVLVELVDTTTIAEDTVIGTGFDLTTVAARFGMSRWMFSGLVWTLISMVVCAGVYQAKSRYGSGGGKLVMIILNFMIIGGGLLGLLIPLAAVLMFIGWGALTAYSLFFRGATV